MSLPIKDQLKYWGIAAVVFLVVLWCVGDVLVPFLLGGAIAYFLDPVADRLEEAGLSRSVATSLITFAALIIFVLLALLVIPSLISQAIRLVEITPELLRQLVAFLTDRFPSLLDENSTLYNSLTSLGVTIKERGGEVLQSALASFASIINTVVVLLIVPVVAVYLLLDWDRMVAALDGLLPREHAPTIRKLAREVDKTLAAFIRGMGTVCLILGTYYAVALMAVGLNFGLVVGFIAGALTFIPYLGAMLGGMLAIGLAMFQFWGDPVSIGMVAGVFVLGQVIEGNFLTPKLVGSSVGLHPVWLILALSVFGSLFGFVGMLVAVPLAASIGVLTRFAISRYKTSLLYTGSDLLPEDMPDKS